MRGVASSDRDLVASSNGASTDLEPVRAESGLHLHWQGRRSYRTAIPTPRVLEPVPELSFGDQDCGNLVIDGDNLQVMVSLQSQFADAIDVVCGCSCTTE